MLFIKIAIGRGLPAIGAIAFNLYVASKLETREADIFFLWFTALYLLSFLGKLGLDTYILREISSKSLASASGSKRAALLTSLIISLITIIFAPSQVWSLLLSLPAFSIISINSSILRAEGKDFLSGFLEVSQLSTAALAVLIASNLQPSELTLSAASNSFALASASILLLSELTLPKKHSIAFGENFVLWHKFTPLRFVPTPLIIFLTQWAVVFFVAKTSEGSASIYAVAVRLASGFAFLAITIDAFASPRFAKYHSLQEPEKIRRLISSIRTKTVPLFGGALLVYALTAPTLIVKFVGPAYLDAFHASLILSLSYFFILIIGPYQSYLLMGSSENKVTFANAISLFCILFGCSMLTLLDATPIYYYASVVAASRIGASLLMRYFAEKNLSRA